MESSHGSPVSLFGINYKKIEDDEEKEEIVSKMSPILFDTLRKILDGTYTVEHEIFTLNINCVEKKYSFSVK